MGIMRKILIGLVVLALLLVALSQIFKAQIGERLFTRAVERQVNSPSRFANLPDGLHVVLVGTGSPLGDPTRMGPSTAVIAGNRIFIVDAGSGSPRNLGQFGIPAGRIEAAFITHFHSDHIDSLGELMLQRWAGGANTQPLPVYGPNGIEDVIAGLNTAYAQDAVYRTAHHGEATVPSSGTGGRAIPFSPTGPMTLLEDDDLKVTGFPVAHEPVDPAVGYRFDYKGRSVTLTGDTAYSTSLIANARDTDLLISEALSTDMVSIIEAATKEAGLTGASKIMSDIPSYHVTPVQAADMAAKANAGQLVFSHIVPALPTPYLNAYFLKGTGDTYDGKITLGQDGMLFSLPANSDRIVFEKP